MASTTDVDVTVNEADYPYGIQAFDDYFPGANPRYWVAVCDPDKQEQLNKERYEVWLKYLETEKVEQGKRFQAENAPPEPVKVAEDKPVEKEKLLVKCGIQMAPKKRKRTTASTKTTPATAPTGGISEISNTISPGNLADDVSSPADSSKEPCEAHTPLGTEPDAQGHQRTEGKKTFAQWADMKVDYQPTLKKPQRGGQKQKKKKENQLERQREKERLVARLAETNWDSKYRLRRAGKIRKYIDDERDGGIAMHWNDLIDVFPSQKRRKLANKPTNRSTMFAPPQELEAPDYAGSGAIANNRSTFASRYMANQGWEQGKGLGAEGNEGIKNALYTTKKRGFGVIRGGTR